VSLVTAPADLVFGNRSGKPLRESKLLRNWLGPIKLSLRLLARRINVFSDRIEDRAIIEVTQGCKDNHVVQDPPRRASCSKGDRRAPLDVSNSAVTGSARRRGWATRPGAGFARRLSEQDSTSKLSHGWWDGAQAVIAAALVSKTRKARSRPEGSGFAW